MRIRNQTCRGVRAMLSLCFMAALGVTAVGCTRSNTIAGHNLRLDAVYMGNMEVAGNGNEVVVRDGSNVPKLSIAGDVNTVIFEDGAVVNQVDVWGNSNTVSVPADIKVISSVAGNNKVVFRKEGEVLELDSPDEADEE